MRKVTHHPDFSKDEKQNARSKSIIDVWKMIRGTNKIPPQTQYWSMAGSHKIWEGSELEQLVRMNLIEQNQYFGVDISEDVYTTNLSVCPTANWICGDFLESMHKARKNGRFNPAIINADLVSTDIRGIPYISRIMKFLSENAITSVFLVVNIMATNPYSKRTLKNEKILKAATSIYEKMKANEMFRYAYGKGNWKTYSNGKGLSRVYVYKLSRTNMATYVFYN